MESSHLGILPKVHYSAMPNNRMESDAAAELAPLIPIIITVRF